MKNRKSQKKITACALAIVGNPGTTGKQPHDQEIQLSQKSREISEAAERIVTKRMAETFGEIQMLPCDAGQRREKVGNVEHQRCEMGVVGCTAEPARVRALWRA